MIGRRTQRDRTDRSRRRGTVYLIVLATVAIVVVAGISGLMFARVRLHEAESLGASAAAGNYASSAVDYGVYLIQTDPAWRSKVPLDGQWVVDRAIGDGVFSIKVVDPGDGDIADSDADPAVLTATGESGSARQIIEVRLEPWSVGVSCLQAALHSAGNVVFSTCTIRSDGIVSTNGSAAASGATVSAAVEAVGPISGAAYYGSTTTGIAARQMPDPSIIAEYVARATVIDYAVISGKVELTVLSPSSNEFGATNPDGIYVIDCQGNNIDIRACRIVGTLILLNPKKNSAVRDSVLWEPAAPNQPVLLANADLTIECSSAALDESVVGVTLNPAGTPYKGSSDTDTTDSYPSEINGLIYVQGDLILQSATTINGVVVVTGATTIGSTPALNHDASFLSNPPYGFENVSTMGIVPGSWARVVE